MNLIAIVGRAGSGKSTVSDILVRDHGFVSLALADPMKRAAKDWFGFTAEQLWGPSEMRNAPDIRFPREHTATSAAGHCDCCGADLYVHGAKPCFLTPRHLLQQLGTQLGRRCYEDVWIEYALRTAEFLLSGEIKTSAPPLIPTYYPQTGAEWMSVRSARVFGKPADGQHWWQVGQYPDRQPAKGVVISDARFPNEVAAIRAKGGRIWKTVHGAGLAGPAGAHESESYIDSLAVDAAVPDSGLDALPGIIANMLQGKG